MCYNLAKLTRTPKNCFQFTNWGLFSNEKILNKWWKCRKCVSEVCVGSVERIVITYSQGGNRFGGDLKLVEVVGLIRELFSLSSPGLCRES